MGKHRKFKPQGPKHVNNKRGRLIIRNLPFSVTEEGLKGYFSECGEVSEVNILKKPNGKLVGCGFIQYVYKQSAAKAIHHFSGKEFGGRPIIVDWAIPKDKFGEINNREKNVNNSVVDESDNSDDVAANSISGNDFERDSKTECKSANDEEQELELSSDDEESDQDECHSVTEEVKLSKTKPAPSHDIPEGKTVFLKNVPFSVNNEELKEFMKQFGNIQYAVICVDPLTEHSRGTAFVKFKNEESVHKCLQEEKIHFNGVMMNVCKALSKNDINTKHEQKHPDKKKDNRNLYLLREGVITAGGIAAQGVSEADMKKRLELEMWKSNMLRNLNMYVSRTRLIIHNLPATYDDADLKGLFKKYTPKTAFITEAKVMKNLRDLDNNGKPTSKGYGFVTFKTHEDALTALRSINNNPNIFNKMKRPIVSFSIENRIMVNAKQRRTEKSKLNNHLCPDHKKPKMHQLNRKKIKMVGNDRAVKEEDTDEEDSSRNFVGSKAKHGEIVKFKSKFKLNNQKEVHKQNVLEEKFKLKRKKQLLERRKEKKRERKIKSKPKKLQNDEKMFNNLVENYKKKIMPHANTFKKWYENE